MELKFDQQGRQLLPTGGNSLALLFEIAGLPCSPAAIRYLLEIPTGTRVLPPDTDTDLVRQIDLLVRTWGRAAITRATEQIDLWRGTEQQWEAGRPQKTGLTNLYLATQIVARRDADLRFFSMPKKRLIARQLASKMLTDVMRWPEPIVTKIFNYLLTNSRSHTDRDKVRIRSNSEADPIRIGNKRAFNTAYKAASESVSDDDLSLLAKIIANSRRDDILALLTCRRTLSPFELDHMWVNILNSY